MSRRRAMRKVGGTPIEEAPLWVLAIFTVLLWLVVFAALAGILAGWGYWTGERLWTALAALAVAVLIVAGLATRKPWRRPTDADLRDDRPIFARFSTWLWTTILVPNVLFGVLVLTNEGPPLTYQHAVAIGALVSLMQGAFALADRWKRRRVE